MDAAIFAHSTDMLIAAVSALALGFIAGSWAGWVFAEYWRREGETPIPYRHEDFT
jgi:hypothetical protein